MALSSAEIYRLKIDQLREVCTKQGLDSTGPVRELRQRLAHQLRMDTMANKQEDSDVQASAQTNLSTVTVQGEAPDRERDSHVEGGSGPVPVFVELMRKVPPLTSDEPEAILRFIARLDEVHMLGLCSDRSFITRILPLVPGVMMRFFGECLRDHRDWNQCKTEIMREFFPHFIRERLIRDLITFRFHNRETPVREHIDQVFAAARILEYGAEEQNLVDRVVMNLHPEVLAHSAFLERPHSRKDLYNVVGLIEEKIAIDKERQRNCTTQVTTSGDQTRSKQTERNVPRNPHPPKCWICGRVGHVQRYCRRNTPQSGNGHEPGGTRTPGREH